MYRCVVNTVVVWLHILGPYWCLYVALFGSRQLAQINALSDYGVTITPKHVGTFFSFSPCILSIFTIITNTFTLFQMTL